MVAHCNVLINQDLYCPCKRFDLFWLALERCERLSFVLLSGKSHDQLHKLVANQSIVRLNLDQLGLGGCLLELSDVGLNCWTFGGRCNELTIDGAQDEFWVDDVRLLTEGTEVERADCWELTLCCELGEKVHEHFCVFQEDFADGCVVVGVLVDQPANFPQLDIVL